jgi:GntR family histidine utilization transcriptional repressor
VTQNTAQPLYQQIKSRLKAQIVSGKLLQGALLPNETELAGQYECSRLTVHRALRELAEEGVVERRRRAGTRVAMRGNTGLMIRLSRITDQISRCGFAYRYELLETRFAVPPDPIAKLLEAHGRQAHLHVRCLHWANNRVFQFEDRWINADVVPKVRAQSFETMSPSLWLLDNVPLSELEHEIAAIAASPDLAAAMHLPANTAILQITRRSTWIKRRVSHARLLYPGDLFHLHSESRS